MKRFFFLIFVVLVHDASMINSLECADGFKISSESLDHLDTNWNIAECPSEIPQACQRKELAIVAFGEIELNAVLGECVNASTCDEKCTVNLHELLDPDEEKSPPYTDYVVNKCESSCCYEDNCNSPRRTIALEPQTSPQSPPTTASSTNAKPATTQGEDVVLSHTSTQSTPLLTCAVDARQSDVIDEDNWNIDICPPDMNYACMRQYIVMTAFETDKDTHTGRCASKADCQKTCYQSADEVTERDEAISLKYCDQECCFEDKCNKKTIEELRAQTNATNQNATAPPTNAEPATTSREDAVKPATTQGEDVVSHTSTQSTPSLTCTVGFSQGNDTNENNWNIETCPPHKNHACIRQYIVMTALENHTVHTHSGRCASKEDCQKKCNQLADEATDREGGFALKSCDQECCYENKCNTKTIEEIRAQINAANQNGANIWLSNILIVLHFILCLSPLLYFY